MDFTQTSVLEIAHVLFVDIVGYSILPTESQRRSIQQLQRAISENSVYQRFEAADSKDRDNLIVLPTGDGAALVFFRDVEAPARCALELAAQLRDSALPVRMGIHTGPVYRIADINANRNVSGGGINVAQRVMDVGDAGHILVSRAVAEVLKDLSAWSDRLHDLGETQVKHGLVVHLFNLYTDEVGNSAIPVRFAAPRAKDRTLTPQPGPSRSGIRDWTNSAASPSQATGREQVLPAPGVELLHYRILEQIGDGGMGVVFAAEDTRLDRRVALKFLPLHQADAVQASERFQREARAASALNHPHICTIYDVGNVSGQEYIAMELLEGRTLKQVIAEESEDMPPDKATIAQKLRWAIQIADALESAHARGIIHRDLKPGNIFITTRSEVKVLDFGLAKLSAAGSNARVLPDADVTTPGVPLGTVAYMSPEQARGNPVDTRTDIFSFGLVLYELFTGNMPFPGGTSAVIFDGILNREPPSVRGSDPSIPAPLDAIIHHAIQKDPANRYLSVAEMRADLESIAVALAAADSNSALRRLTRSRAHLATQRAKRPLRLRPYALAATALLAIGAGIWFSRRHVKPPVTVQKLPRQITFAGAETAIQSSGISPDGKYVAYGDPAGLHLRLVATGESRKLADSPYVSAICWTPDTSRLVIAEGGAEVNSTYVSVVSTTTGEKRKIIDHAFLSQGCVSADNARITLIRTDLVQVWSIGMNGEEPTKLMDGPKGREILMAIPSPDGKWMAVMIDAGGKPPMIEICPATPTGTGNNCKTIVEDRNLISPGGIVDMAWDHGNNLLYAKAEPSPNQYNSRIWSVAAATVMNADSSSESLPEPTEILAVAGEFPADLSFTSDDRHFAYTASHLTTKLRRADLELDGLARPTRLLKERSLTGEESYESPFAWTPDGGSILSISTRPDGQQITRRDLASGDTQSLATGSMRSAVAITGDGLWAIYAAGAQKGDQTPSRILRVPVKGGLSEVVVDHIRPIEVSCARTLRCILAELKGDKLVISAFDPLKGRGEEFLRIDAKAFGNVVISPDGQQVLLGQAERDQFLTLYDLRTRTSSQIHIQRYGNLDNLSFAPDGRSLYGVFWAPAATLVHVTLDGHTQPLRESPIGITGFAISPDDRQIVFGETQGEANVWIADRD